MLNNLIKRKSYLQGVPGWVENLSWGDKEDDSVVL